MMFEERGGDEVPFVTGRAFDFRGALPFAGGDDYREWEGTAWLDPFTGDLLSVEAQPSSQRERLAMLRDRRNRHSLGFQFFEVFRFRIGPKADGKRVEASFGLHDGGFWLPTVTRMETFEAVTPTDTSPVKVVVDSIGRCRKFHTEATPSEATAKRD
jgi:hypothetical protein